MLAFTHAHSATAYELVAEVCDGLGTDNLISVCSDGIVGRSREVEEGPAACLVAGALESAEARVFSIDFDDWKHALDSESSLIRQLNLPEDPACLIVLADPFSTPSSPLLDRLDELLPGLPIIGGLAGGARVPGSGILGAGRYLYGSGFVGLAIGGDVDLDLVVSQGCRPVGPIFEVTAAHRNMIMGLNGRVPAERFQALMQDLAPEDRQLLRGGLFLGRAANPKQSTPGRGDFLIRKVMGMDEESGILALADIVHEGDLVQFQLRDARTAEEDLSLLLTPHSLLGPPAGGLVFSCRSRGSQLYGRPNRDIEIIRSHLGDIDLAGMYCAGEIGPIGGRSFVHGHTLSMLLFH